ncbi:MAG: hypothetical protein M1448_04005 [Candidatus Marsarchaeota archaeon]|nr:hypothetical protein [Candidatus Marsarchaeota archaeon]
MADNIRKIKTGVEGLDDMLNGGIPVNNQVLIAGAPGVGKTLLTMEILLNNVMAGNNSAFIALEERPATIVTNFKETFPDRAADMDKVLNDKSLIIDGEYAAERLTMSTDSSSYSFGNTVSDIEEVIRQNDAKCLALDSISLMKIMFNDPGIYRKSLLAQINNFKRLNVNSFVTVELPSLERTNMKYSSEFFIFDGIIALYQISHENERVPVAEVVKMRGTKHSMALAPYEITPAGFSIMGPGKR